MVSSESSDELSYKRKWKEAEKKAEQIQSVLIHVLANNYRRSEKPAGGGKVSKKNTGIAFYFVSARKVSKYIVSLFPLTPSPGPSDQICIRA